MDAFERAWLEALGYNADNTQACRDYNAGLITLAALTSILDANIVLMTGFRGPVTPVRKSDLVHLEDNNRYGQVCWIDREGEAVNVLMYDTKELDEIPLEEFDRNYSSKGGRTTWHIQGFS